MTTPQRIALCYSRMSNGDTKEQLQRQADDIRDICRLADYIVRSDLCWSDEDESGNRDTRQRQGKTVDPPGILALDKALRDLTAQGHHVAVVGWKADRLFRDVGAKEDYFRPWAQINGNSDGDVPLIIVHTADAHWIPGVATDRFTSSVITASNQHYSDQVREKVVRAHKQRRKDGKMGTGFGGFGYDPKPVRKKTLDKTPARNGETVEQRAGGAGWTVNKKEARLIRKAAKELLAGKAALQIVREWQAADVPTSLGGQWTATSFRRAMTKPTLAGILVHRGREIGKGDWEPILDEATLRQLQALFDRPLSRPRLSRGLLTGALYCGTCDGFVRLHQNAKGSNPVKRVYGCNQCGGSNIDAEAVEAIYVERLWERLDDPRFRKTLNADDGSQAVLAELAKHEADKELLKANADKIPVDVYVAKAESIEKELARLRGQLEQCQRPSLGWLHDPQRLKRAWKTMDKGSQRALLLDVVGPSKVLSAGTSGRRATRQRVLTQLRLIEGPIPA